METLPELRATSIANVAESLMLAKREGGLGRTIFFVGAGCSVSAGIPTAPEIAKIVIMDLANRFGVREDADDPVSCYQKLLDHARIDPCFVQTSASPSASDIDWYKVYDHCFERHLRSPDDVRELFGGLIAKCDGTINWAHLCLGELAAKGWTSTVITTNFDQLVLAGMANAGLLPVVCDGTESLNRISATPHHPQLIELHGSRHTYRLRNRRVDVANVARQDPAISAIIGLFSQATTFVAVGYGGREDGVMDLLIRAAFTYPDKTLYWVTHNPEAALIGEKVRAFLATSVNSCILTGQDADCFFLELSREMSLGTPTAVAFPLMRAQNVLRGVRRSQIAGTDIEAEVTRAEALLSHLGDQQAAYLDLATPENLAARVRTLRMEGRIRDAYELAVQFRANGDAVPSEVLEELARAAKELGDHHLGENQELAIARYGEAIAASQKALEQSQFSPSAAEVLSESLSRLGDAYGEAGDFARAKESYSEAMAVNQQLAQRFPDNAQVQRFSATTHERLGSVMFKLGNLAEAKGSLEAALTIRKDIAQRGEAEPVPQRALAGSYGRLAEVLADQGDFSRAEECHRSAISICEALVAAQPTEREFLLGLADAKDQLGVLIEQGGDWPAAKEHYHQAFEIRKKMLEAGAQSTEMQRYLLLSYGRLGQVLRKLGDQHGSQLHNEKALALARELVTANPGSAFAKNDLAVTLGRIAKTMSEQGERESAKMFLREAIGIDDELIEKDRNAQWLRHLRSHQVFLGDIHIDGAELDEAQTLYEAAAEIASELVGTDLSSAESKRDHSIALERLGDLAEKRTSFADAVGYYEESLKIVEEIAGANPGNQRLANDLKLTQARIEQLRAKLVIKTSPARKNGGGAAAPGKTARRRKPKPATKSS